MTHSTTTTRLVGWGDNNETPEWNDGCPFAAARLITVAACLVLLVLKAVRR